LLSSAISKSGIVFNVSLGLCVCINKPKSGSRDMSRSVDHQLSGCKYIGRCLYGMFVSSASSSG